MNKGHDESTNRRALVIDDEERVRKSLKILLSKRNYIIEEAVDGEQAIEKILTGKYELIICDIRIPKKDGWEVLRVIRSNPKSKDVPVIILGRQIDNEDMKRVYNMGAIDLRINNAIVRVKKGEDRTAEYIPAKETEKKSSSRSRLPVHPSTRPEYLDGRWPKCS